MIADTLNKVSSTINAHSNADVYKDRLTPMEERALRMKKAYGFSLMAVIIGMGIYFFIKNRKTP